MHRRTLALLLAVSLLSSVVTLGLARLAFPTATATTAASQDPAVVRAQRFELVDAGGTVRARIAFLPDGRPLIALFDESGQVRASLAQNLEREYGFGITDGQGTSRFAVGTTTRGFVGLNVRDGSGTIRANLYASDDGRATGFRT